MKQKASKIFWGVLLILTAAAMIFYGVGDGSGIFGIPMHKMLLGIVITAWIIAKILFSSSLRERFKVFFPLGLLFILFEEEIAYWNGIPENIIDNWIVIAAAILMDIAVSILIPRGKRVHSSRHSFEFNGETEHSGFGEAESFDKNALSDSTVYIDADKTKKSWVENKLGETNVFYQNTDIADPAVPLELNVINYMGEITIHVPADWVVVNKMSCALGEVNTRPNLGNGITLTVTGENKMGETNIV